MSLYQFPPTPNFGVTEHEFVTWQDGFTPEELDKIIEVSESRIKQEAVVGTKGEGENNPTVRVSDVAWLELANDTGWIYDRLAYIANQLNGQFYKFDLYGFAEHFQYTVYEAEKNGHYDWHIDGGVERNAPRKFSIVLQLSDPDSYEGGDLEVLSGPSSNRVLRQRGMIAAFPSYRLHRVTPVTKGIRKTLVAWIAGPSFR